MYERLQNDSFKSQRLLGATLSGIIDLAVVDWDGDRKLDLLLCSEMEGSARISLLRHSELPLMGRRGGRSDPAGGCQRV